MVVGRHLHRELSLGTQPGGEAREQGLVIGKPVQSRVREHDVHGMDGTPDRDVSLLEAPAVLPGVQPDPAALVEEAIAGDSVLIFGQRPGSLSGRKSRTKPTIPEQATLFG